MVEPGGMVATAARAGAWFGLPRRQLQRVVGYGAARAIVELLIGARGMLLAGILGTRGLWRLVPDPAQPAISDRGRPWYQPGPRGRGVGAPRTR